MLTLPCFRFTLFFHAFRLRAMLCCLFFAFFHISFHFIFAACEKKKRSDGARAVPPDERWRRADGGADASERAAMKSHDVIDAR